MAFYTEICPRNAATGQSAGIPYKTFQDFCKSIDFSRCVVDMSRYADRVMTIPLMLIDMNLGPFRQQ